MYVTSGVPTVPVAVVGLVMTGGAEAPVTVMVRLENDVPERFVALTVTT